MQKKKAVARKNIIRKSLSNHTKSHSLYITLVTKVHNRDAFPSGSFQLLAKIPWHRDSVVACIISS